MWRRRRPAEAPSVFRTPTLGSDDRCSPRFDDPSDEVRAPLEMLLAVVHSTREGRLLERHVRRPLPFYLKNTNGPGLGSSATFFLRLRYAVPRPLTSCARRHELGFSTLPPGIHRPARSTWHRMDARQACRRTSRSWSTMIRAFLILPTLVSRSLSNSSVSHILALIVDDRAHCPVDWTRRASNRSTKFLESLQTRQIELRGQDDLVSLQHYMLRPRRLAVRHVGYDGGRGAAHQLQERIDRLRPLTTGVGHETRPASPKSLHLAPPPPKCIAASSTSSIR